MKKNAQQKPDATKRTAVIPIPTGARYVVIPKGFAAIFKDSQHGEYYTTDVAITVARDLDFGLADALATADKLLSNEERLPGRRSAR